MKTINSFLKWAPEVYLIIASLIYWKLSAMPINYFAIGFIALLILQIIIKVKISGLIISTLFLFVNIYMLLALLSELNEFPSFTLDAKNMLIMGLLYFGANLVCVAFMFRKYFKRPILIVP